MDVGTSTYQTKQYLFVENMRDKGGIDELIPELMEVALPIQQAYAEIMLRHNGCPIGIEHRHKSREAWAFVLPDASVPGKYRVQYFDEHGFFSHDTHDTIEDVVEEMVRSGYSLEEMGALNRLSKTETWRKGTENAGWLMQLNAGRITHSEYLQKTGGV